MKYYAHFGHTDFTLCLGPNVFVELEESLARRKAEAIVESFTSQASKHWFREDLFLALLRLRGVECAAPAKYAEGFHCRKAVLSC